MTSPSNIETKRHSYAHIMAHAVRNLWPDAKLGIGPIIEHGFYYDFDLPRKFSPEDLPKIEKEMRRLIGQGLKFERENIEYANAQKFFKKEKQPYKLELIKDLKKTGEKISVYKVGEFTDLCRGPHIKSTEELAPDAFKLTKVAGAYWKGSEKNAQLQRIYGIAFNSKSDLDAHLKMLAEAERRDHRRVGRELDLFSFHEEGPGFPFWHPKGTILFNELVDFIRRENERRGYGEVKTPPILNKRLWLASGHWEKFRNDMYFTEIDKEEYAVKPMNCPGTILVYKDHFYSYKDLPVRLAEFGLVHRHELSGVLHGLFRVRSFTQDDAHVFCSPDQLDSEIISMVDYAVDVYQTFGFKKYEIFIATRPEKYIGDEAVWKKSTTALKRALKERGLDFKIKEGEGAFYGPKIEFNIKDAIGRNWQLGTIQVDFSMPERLHAEYVDKSAKKKIPVMVHRAILGSLERFIGVLLEHYAGALPLWLSPAQAAVLPVGEKFNKYGVGVLKELKFAGIRAELYDSDDTLGKKIRNAEKQKIPYILIIGEKEEQSGTITVRARGVEKQETVKLKKVTEKILREIQDKK